ncbi:MAG: CaiB/BaiF CoA transferase family protein [Gammaproteobacteria bacterium]
MQPLKGVRIIEATANAAGPFATGMLADQGAEVIRIETLGGGDPSRHVGGIRGGVTSYTAYMNRNKKSIAIDIKNPAAKAPLFDLIKTADVFVQNARPGALERAGFGFDTLHAINPQLIYASISGFGMTGPAVHQRVYDAVIQAVSGLAFAAGDNGVPALVKSIVTDKITGMTAAQAISSALFARENGTIGGHHIEISMLDSSLAFLWPDIFWNHGFVGDDGVTPKPSVADFYRVVQTKDGYVTILVVGDEDFDGACRGLEIPKVRSDPRFQTLEKRFTHYNDMCREIEKAALNFTTNEIVKRMDEGGVPCAKVNDLDDVFSDPRVTHNQSIVEYDHPDGGRLRQARPPAIFDEDPCPIRLPSPRLGEHTEEVLRAAGCDDETISALRAANAIS